MGVIVSPRLYSSWILDQLPFMGLTIMTDVTQTICPYVKCACRVE